MSPASRNGCRSRSRRMQEVVDAGRAVVRLHDLAEAVWKMRHAVALLCGVAMLLSVEIADTPGDC